jgi:hypothetical protein
MKKHIIFLLTCLFGNAALLCGQFTTVYSSRPESAYVLYLDFDGHSDNSGYWDNWGFANPIVTAASTFTGSQIKEVFFRVSEDYRPFDINITTSLSVYNAAASANRQRIVVTPTSAFYTNQNGNVGGIAFISTFGTGEIAGYVFTNNLSENAKFVAEACSHEAGHTLGLNHQSEFNNLCSKTAEYNDGTSTTGEEGWAPIMGIGYYKNLTQWYNGPGNGTTCTAGSQNDLAIITSNNGFSYIPDDIGNSITNSTALTFSSGYINQIGLISTTNDVDFYRFTAPSSGNYAINVTPVAFNQAGNDGANLDVKLTVYGTSGIIISTSDPGDRLDASTIVNLSSGQTYFFSIDGTGLSSHMDFGGLGPNDYGSLGRYTATVVTAFNQGTLASTNEVLCNPADPASIAFSIAAAAGSTYQWYYQDGIIAAPATTADLTGWTAITGATAASYDPPSGLTSSRTYACRVSNGSNSQWASGARPITVRAVVNNGTIAAGNQTFTGSGDPSVINLSTAVSGGSGTFAYQWYSASGIQAAPSGTTIPAGWTAISGATTASYDPPVISASTTYALRTDPTGTPDCGVATWSTGVRQITITSGTTFSPGTLASGNQTLCNGGDPASIAFSIAATSGSAFQWYYQNGIVAAPSNTAALTGWTAITGATAASYDPPSGLTTSRTYACRVTYGTNAQWATGVRQITILPAFAPGSLMADQSGCAGYNPNPITMTSNPQGSGGYNWKWFYVENTTATCPTGSADPTGWTTSTTDLRFFGTSTTGTGIYFDPTSAGANGRTWVLKITPAANGSSPSCGTAALTNCHKTNLMACRQAEVLEEEIPALGFYLSNAQPNPWNLETEIQIQLPTGKENGRIVVRSMEGKIVQTHDISGSERQSLSFRRDHWPAGVYFYSLEAGGEPIATRKMVITQ